MKSLLEIVRESLKYPERDPCLSLPSGREIVRADALRKLFRSVAERGVVAHLFVAVGDVVAESAAQARRINAD
jgi:hypothetical protein